MRRPSPRACAFAEGSGNQTRPRRAASLPARRLRSAFRVRYQMYFRYVVMGGFPELVIFLSLCMTDHSSVKPKAGRGSLAICSVWVQLMERTYVARGVRSRGWKQLGKMRDARVANGIGIPLISCQFALSFC